MESEKKSSYVSDVGAWAMNVVSSVGIIMANKQLMSANGYAFTFGKSPFCFCFNFSGGVQISLEFFDVVCFRGGSRIWSLWLDFGLIQLEFL